ncbi:transposase [Alicyclobacillus mali (ex Roth et al. 2021)]|uniref:transposase n=1 Tax=Alicyclobacillus mali (ex Roth et al. 2021) TaxID=1123961 RepID=UPI001A8ED86A|nr:transposase [Alicyclobacillus mali (ex Roth et al. 2021)]
MARLCKPEFKELSSFSNVGGAPVLRTLWDRFDLSLLLSQSGIFKVRGVATWVLAFLYVVGLINRCPSVNALATFFNKDGLLQRMLGIQKVTQSTLSRFLTGFSQWDTFNEKRTSRLQEDPDTALADGDVLALDDTHAPHPYAKGIPFLYWLYDSSNKVYTWAMNIVALHAVRSNGVEYPWSYAIWTKPENDTDKKQSKLDLAWRMLLAVRKQVTCRLWVVMDRWYFSKPFLLQCESENFDWVTKAKRNMQLFRRMIEPGTGRERFVPIRPRDLIREVYPLLMAQGNVDVASVACENIYVKMPKTSVNRRGEPCTKMKYTPVAAVVGKRIKPEDNKATTQPTELVDSNEPVETEEPATEYKGAYLLISNRHDAPSEVMGAWLKRWRIEVLFRTAKQELGMLNCHSPNQNHIHAHMTLLFTAETLVRYLVWEQRKTADEEDCTHGQVIRNLLCVRCHARQAARTNEPDLIVIDLDAAARHCASLIDKFWPKRLELTWFDPENNQLLRATA